MYNEKKILIYFYIILSYKLDIFKFIITDFTEMLSSKRHFIKKISFEKLINNMK